MGNNTHTHTQQKKGVVRDEVYYIYEAKEKKLVTSQNSPPPPQKNAHRLNALFAEN